jgi:hypothetical protein
VQNLALFRSRGFVAVAVAALYVKKCDFSQFLLVFRLWRRLSTSSRPSGYVYVICDFFLNFKPLDGPLGARQVPKFRNGFKKSDSAMELVLMLR